MSLRFKVLKSVPAALEAAFPGWRLPLKELGHIERRNPFTKEPFFIPTWDPSPKATFPAEALFPFDDVPGEEAPWAALIEKTFQMGFLRRAELADGTRPSLIGPDGRVVNEVPEVVLKGVLTAKETFEDLGERMARFAPDAENAIEHAKEMKVSPADYFELPLHELRKRTFSPEKTRQGKAWWDERFKLLAGGLERLASLGRSLEGGERLFYVLWFTDEE